MVTIVARALGTVTVALGVVKQVRRLFLIIKGSAWDLRRREMATCFSLDTSAAATLTIKQVAVATINWRVHYSILKKNCLQVQAGYWNVASAVGLQTNRKKRAGSNSPGCWLNWSISSLLEATTAFCRVVIVYS